MPLLIVISLIVFCVPIVLHQARKNDRQSGATSSWSWLLDEKVCVDLSCCSIQSQIKNSDGLEDVPCCPCAASMPCCQIQLKLETKAAMAVLTAAIGGHTRLAFPPSFHFFVCAYFKE